MSDVFGLKAAKFAILTITQTHPPAQSIHLQLDNVVALSSLVKMGGWGGGGVPTTKFSRYKQRDLELIAGQKDHN